MKLLSVVLSGILIALAFVIEGFVLNILWGWFVVPLGVAAISIGHAIGLATVIGLVTHQYNLTKPHSEMTESERISAAGALLIYLFVRPALVYLIGWIAHFYM